MTTTEQITSILYRLVNGSVLKAEISGDVYASEDRPLQSRKEDVVISVLENRAGQFQHGTAYVNIFVPKVSDGTRLIRDRGRILVLGTIAADLLEVVAASEYVIKLERQVVRLVPEIDQHCIINELSFTFINF